MKTSTHKNANGDVISVNSMDFNAMCNMMAWHLSKTKNPVSAMRQILFFGATIPLEDEWNLSYRESMPENWQYKEAFLVNKSKLGEFIDCRHISLADFHKVITSEFTLHEALNENHFVFVSPPVRR